MRTAIQTLPTAALLLALGACGDSGTHPAGKNPMTTQAAALAGRVTELKKELATHKDAVHMATDVAAINAHEGTHHTAALGELGHMDHDLMDMAHCENAEGMMPDTKAFAALRSDANAECNAHNAAMATAATLAAAHTEEDRHQAAMESMVTKMTADGEMMMHSASGYSCTANEGH